MKPPSAKAAEENCKEGARNAPLRRNTGIAHHDVAGVRVFHEPAGYSLQNCRVGTQPADCFRVPRAAMGTWPECVSKARGCGELASGFFVLWLGVYFRAAWAKGRVADSGPDVRFLRAPGNYFYRGHFCVALLPGSDAVHHQDRRNCYDEIDGHERCGIVERGREHFHGADRGAADDPAVSAGPDA